MRFEYIDDNLLSIMNNPDNVMYIKPYNMGKKFALFAMVKEDDGVYRKVQLTLPQTKFNFPKDPILIFSQGLGRFYLKNFFMFDNSVAFNKKYFVGFKCKTVSERFYFNLGIFAIFNDGTATLVVCDNERKFRFHGGYKKYDDFLSEHGKEFKLTNVPHEIIESYREDEDTFVIPNLQQNKQKVYKKDNYKQI